MTANIDEYIHAVRLAAIDMVHDLNTDEEGDQAGQAMDAPGSREPLVAAWGRLHALVAPDRRTE